VIRINLLPYHEMAKKENIKRQISVIVLSFIAFCLLIIAAQIQVSLEISSLGKAIKNKESRLAMLNKEVGDVERVKKEKAILEKKLSVIMSLDQDRLYPVKMLDDINIRIPARQLWLEKLTQTGMELRIEGVARDNTVVARFMKNLELSPYIQFVDLGVAKQEEFSGNKFQRFNITCILKKGIS
jgi:type IV pilus assembly protein PilN